MCYVNESIKKKKKKGILQTELIEESKNNLPSLPLSFPSKKQTNKKDAENRGQFVFNT